MRREEQVTVQGPVKEQQPDGVSHRGGGVSVGWASGRGHGHVWVGGWVCGGGGGGTRHDQRKPQWPSQLRMQPKLRGDSVRSMFVPSPPPLGAVFGQPNFAICHCVCLGGGGAAPPTPLTSAHAPYHDMQCTECAVCKVRGAQRAGYVVWIFFYDAVCPPPPVFNYWLGHTSAIHFPMVVHCCALHCPTALCPSPPPPVAAGTRPCTGGPAYWPRRSSPCACALWRRACDASWRGTAAPSCW